MLIDFHTHCFPDAIAERAVTKLAGIGNIPYYSTASAEANIRLMDECGVDISVVCSIATNVKQQTNVNNFAIELNSHPRFYALGSVHPDCPRDIITSDLERIKEAGLKGIKVHPDYMEAYLDDDRFMFIFDECDRLGLFVMTHAGYDFYSPDDPHCTPDRILRVSEAFPSLRLIAAHVGSNRYSREVYEKLCGRENLWFELSLLAIEPHEPEFVKKILTEHSSNRLMFGSDMPWCRPDVELDIVKGFVGEGELLEKIKYKNALMLLGGK